MSNVDRHEELSIRAMTDLGMEPEAFGGLLYTATARYVRGIDPSQLCDEGVTARRKLLALPYGGELYRLERQLNS